MNVRNEVGCRSVLEDKPKKKRISSFAAFCTTVGMLTITVAVMFAVLVALGGIYSLIEPAILAVGEFLITHSMNILIVIALVGVLCYGIDHIIQMRKK